MKTNNKPSFFDKCLQYVASNLAHDNQHYDTIKLYLIDPLIKQISKELYPFMKFVTIILMVNTLVVISLLVLLVLSHFKSNC